MSNGASDKTSDLTQLLQQRDPAARALLNVYAPALEQSLGEMVGTYLSPADQAQIVAQALDRALEVGQRFDPQRVPLLRWLRGWLEEQALVVAVTLGKHDATLMLLYTYVPRLDRDLVQQFGARIAPEDRQDIIYNVILRAHQHGNRYNPALARPEAWLRSMAHFEALSFLRTSMDATTIDAVTKTAAVVFETESLYQALPDVHHLEQLLCSLPTRRAEAVRRYLAGDSYEVIAAELQTSNGNIRSHVSRGLSALREHLTSAKAHRCSGRCVGHDAHGKGHWACGNG